MRTRPAAAHVALAVPVLAVPALAVLLLVGTLTAPAAAWTGPVTSGARVGAPDRLAVELLNRAMAAPALVSYTGTQYVSAWSAVDPSVSTSAVVDVTHEAGGGIVLRAHGARPLPVVEERSRAGWLAGAGGAIGLLVKAYDVVVAGEASVAGRPAYVVEARRPDGTTAARLWLDREVALPLRREVYDERGVTRSASAFVEIDITQPDEAATAADSGPRTLAGTAGTLHLDDLAELRAHGWPCPEYLDRGLVLYEAKRLGDAVQLSYSDGVATVSVFEQPGQLDPDKLEGFAVHQVGEGTVYAAPGPPSQFVWSTGDHVVTVVTDAPMTAVDAVLAALPPRESAHEQGLLARIGRGAERLAAWVNPFD